MKIEMKNGKLVVPDYPAIGYIRGDGVGEDIFPQAQKVFDAAVLKIYGQKKKRKLQVQVSQPSSSHMNSYS